MTVLGLRYCPNHPTEPLMLVSRASGTYWRCEHESGCAHTENAVSVRSHAGVVAVNGKSLPHARSSAESRVRTQGGSKVERDAIEALESES